MDNLDFQFLLDEDEGVIIEGDLPKTILISQDCLITVYRKHVVFKKNKITITKTAEEFYDFLTEIEWGLI
jgi:hypothetical protein